MVLEAGMPVLSRSHKHAAVFFGGQGFGRQVQVPLKRRISSAAATS